MKQVIVILIVFLTMSSNCNAENNSSLNESSLKENFYVGLGFTTARYDTDCSCQTTGGTDKTAGMIVRLGMDFNDIIGIEVRGLVTNWQLNGGGIDHFGLFLKPMYGISKEINIYGLLGYAKTSTTGVKRNVDAQTLAWGFGFEYDFEIDIDEDEDEDEAKKKEDDRPFDGQGNQETGWGLSIDYERLVQKTGSPDLDTINFAITYDF